MATYEVASAVAPFAERMLASEESEPGIGWDYTSLQSIRGPWRSHRRRTRHCLADTLQDPHEEGDQGST